MDTPNLPFNDLAKPQMSKRKDMNATDQWGRKWLVQIQKETMQPCGAIEACFTDPLGTPMQYLSVPEGNLNTILIDYPRWIRDLETAHREYEDRAADLAHQMYGDQFERALKRRPRELVRIIGPAPLEVERVKLAAAGDRGWLGLEPLPVPVPAPKRARRRAEPVAP